jgi:hypothetical protein
MGAIFKDYHFVSGGAVNTLTSASITLDPGDLVVFCIDVGNATEQTVSSIVDNSLGNTVHRLAATHYFNAAVFSGTVTEIWYVYNAIGGTTTFSASWPSAGGFSVLQIGRWGASPGWGSSDPIDTSNGSGSSGTPLVHLNLAQPNELVVGFFTLVTGAGWVWTNATDRAGVGGNGICDSSTAKSLGDYQPMASGGYDVTGTGGSSTFFVGSAAAFKVPASKAKPVVCIME